MAVLTVPRVFGGTVFITYTPAVVAPPVFTTVLAKGRDGRVTGTGRDGITQGKGR